jgi:hypothetical protein
VTDTLLITRNGVPEEMSIAENSSGKSLSISPCDIESTTHRLSQEATNNMNRIKCFGKAALTGDSSASTAIGDELAEIHNHMEHCRSSDCLHAKDFFDGIQSPRE